MVTPAVCISLPIYINLRHPVFKFYMQVFLMLISQQSLVKKHLFIFDSTDTDPRVLDPTPHHPGWG